MERENQWLREQLDYAQTRPGLELRGAQIVARVIGRESNNFLEYIMLDLGQVHGVQVGMSVMTDQGLVGRISEVTDYHVQGAVDHRCRAARSTPSCRAAG